jgi:hypothetical protein
MWKYNTAARTMIRTAHGVVSNGQIEEEATLAAASAFA